MLYYTWVRPNYFQTLGIPLLVGHGFPSQTGQPEHLVILSESAAQRLWPGQNPIGRSLRLGTGEQFHNKGKLLPDGPTWQITDVARDTRGVTLDSSDSEQVYGKSRMATWSLQLFSCAKAFHSVSLCRSF